MPTEASKSHKPYTDNCVGNAKPVDAQAAPSDGSVRPEGLAGCDGIMGQHPKVTRRQAAHAVLVSAVCDYLLQQLVRGEAIWCSSSPIHGRRQRDVAERLVSRGLARIIPRGVDSVDQIYVVIPPNAEWDYQRDQIRVAGGASHG